MDSRGYVMALEEAEARLKAVTERLTRERDECREGMRYAYDRFKQALPTYEAALQDERGERRESALTTTLVAIAILVTERDEARADAEAAWNHAHRSWDETEVFCALLRDIEFSCELAGPEGCWWCGSTREQGHTPDCLLRAVLEKHDGTSRRSGPFPACCRGGPIGGHAADCVTLLPGNTE